MCGEIDLLIVWELVVGALVLLFVCLLLTAEVSVDWPQAP